MHPDSIRRSLIAALAALMLISTSSRTPGAAAQDLAPCAAPAIAAPISDGLSAIGDRVTSGAYAVTANRVRTTDRLGEYTKAKPGQTFVVVDVTIENVGRDTAPYNPLFFSVKDADGYEYTASLAGADQALKSGELAAGDKVRGAVAFSVPSAAGLVMRYQRSSFLGGDQPIRIMLG